MDSPSINVPSPENQNTGFLSTTFETQQDSSTRLRSTSIAPSVRSHRSDITVVEEHSEVPVLDKKAFQRRHTHTIEIKIPRWKCFLGFLFGSRIAERAAITTIKAPDVDEGDGDAFDNKECPFILSVHVLSSEKVETRTHQQARCTFDTGCLQGNIVSKNFAQKLGYSEPEYKPLNSREKQGGTSATGHTHMPDGVLFLTWYHNSSPLLFRDMRFLVSSNQQCDIVIGAHSIVKHKLLSLPNFMSTTIVTLPSEDKTIAKHRAEIANLENEIKTLGKDRSQEKDEDEVKKLDKKIKKLETSLAAEKKAKEVREEQLESKNELNKAATAVSPPKADEKKTQALKAHEIPHIKVLEANGNVRSATGFFSISSGARPRAHK